ncbi:MAG: J domain-containing protein [Vicinamibacterales bacterium]
MVDAGQGDLTCADYSRVWGRTFAEVLDDALGVAAGPASYASRSATTFTHQPAHPLLFARLSAVPGAHVTYVTTSRFSTTGVGQAVMEAPALAEVRRPVRTLTPVQQRALDTLNAHGARLRPDFTSAELRRAYRQLALSIHPDRHPHATAVEREHLTRAFADASESCRRLVTLVDPTH